MSVSTEDFRWVADFLRTESAISIGPGKEYLVESRLNPLVQAIGLPDMQTLVHELRRPGADPAIKERVIEAMTTNETSFFRDIHPFQTLKKHVLPELIAARAASRTLRIWSAASSTGQELFSIAMMIDHEYPELGGWRVELSGTDLSREVVRRSRTGRFSALEVNRGLPAPMLVKYLARDGADYVLAGKIRDRCSFDVGNLAVDWPRRPAMDVIFCRNVLIYFELDIRNLILQRLRRDLATGGYLFLGAAETSHAPPEGFVAMRLGNSVVYRKEQ